MGRGRVGAEIRGDRERRKVALTNLIILRVNALEHGSILEHVWDDDHPANQSEGKVKKVEHQDQNHWIVEVK